MDETLRQYIERDFKYTNLKKYHKYFEIWLNALTPTQIEYWKLRMNGRIC